VCNIIAVAKFNQEEYKHRNKQTKKRKRERSKKREGDIKRYKAKSWIITKK
jgi:hypothetical protein